MGLFENQGRGESFRQGSDPETEGVITGKEFSVGEGGVLHVGGKPFRIAKHSGVSRDYNKYGVLPQTTSFHQWELPMENGYNLLIGGTFSKTHGIHVTHFPDSEPRPIVNMLAYHTRQQGEDLHHWRGVVSPTGGPSWAVNPSTASEFMSRVREIAELHGGSRGRG